MRVTGAGAARGQEVKEGSGKRVCSGLRPGARAGEAPWVGGLLAHLEVLLRGVRARPGAEGDEAHRTGRLAVLAGHLEQRPLVPLHQGQGPGQGEGRTGGSG